MTDEQHKADLDRVSSQNSFTDLSRGVEDRPRGSGFFDNLMYTPLRAVIDQTQYGKSMHGRTDFEGYDLNGMLDLIEETNPEDLESSGKALWDARDAFKAAAVELNGHIEHVEWKGESGTAFREWGGSLVENAHALSDFAGGAGDQLTAAAVGLASVRSAMPPRDTRPKAEQHDPKHFTKVQQAASPSDYATAVRVEKHRQEAINQMNRLSSYYAVSRDTLKSLNESAPTFAPMPDVGVPKPVGESRFVSGESNSTGTQGAVHAVVPSHHETVASTGHVRVHASDTSARSTDVTAHTVRPDEPVRTHIDSVGTLPPTSTTPVPVHAPPTMGTPATGGGPINAFTSGLGTPIPPASSGRSTGRAGGLRTPASAQGRAGTSGLGESGAGRSAGRGSMNQMGRATATGQSAAKGNAPGAKPSPTGRGITGGTPRAGGTTSPRASGGSTTGAGRTNGVVGGRPTSTSGQTVRGGAKIPRGTVVGAEESANSRSVAGSPGQRGVIGASEPATRSGSSGGASRRGPGSSEAVTGRPAERNSVARAERNGMTRGGAGLVRGPGGHGKPGDGDDAQGASRPDCAVDEEATHPPTKPRHDMPRSSTERERGQSTP